MTKKPLFCLFRKRGRHGKNLMKKTCTSTWAAIRLRYTIPGRVAITRPDYPLRTNQMMASAPEKFKEKYSKA